MADQSDVETALVGLAAAALDADLRAGKVNVTVFPAPGTGRTSTRYTQEWVGLPVTPSLTAQVAGASVTFGGAAAPGQIAGLAIDGETYAYRTQAGDNPALVAANLAVPIRTTRIVQVSGSTLTVPGAGEIVARVVADAPAQQEVRRQTQLFRITCWCPTPQSRDAAAGAVDLAMAPLTFLDLADGSKGRVIYAGTTVFDQSQDALLYRRDLLYSVEYATVLSASQPAMLFGTLGVNATHFVA